MTEREDLERKIVEAKQLLSRLEDKLNTNRNPHVFVKGETFGSGELVVDIGACYGFPEKIITTTNGGQVHSVFVRQN